jgi:hypothetical protein
MKGNVASLMKDVVLLAVSVYLVKQDALRASVAKAERSQRQQVSEPRDWAAVQVAAM